MTSLFLPAKLPADAPQQDGEAAHLDKAGEHRVEDADPHQQEQQPAAPEKIGHRADTGCQMSKDLLHEVFPPF